ncbi:MAG TPA: Ig-like domain-containing protein [Acidimicrobiales bacterium]
MNSRGHVRRATTGHISARANKAIVRLVASVGVIGAGLFVVALPAQAASPVPTYTWSGADAATGANYTWSDGANWVGGLAPTTGTPVNLVFPLCTVGSCTSNDNIDGLTAASLSIANVSTSGGTLNLTGPLTVTGSNASVVALNLEEATGPTWTFTDQNITFGEVTGSPVTVILAGGSHLTSNFETSGLAIEGANPAAAPASNGTIEGTVGDTGAYYADVAINWPVESGTGPFATSGDAINMTSGSNPFGLQPAQDIFVNGLAKLDPTSSITFNGANTAGMLPGSSVWSFPALDEQSTAYGINLNGANLALTGCPAIGSVGTLVTSTRGVTGTFNQMVGGKQVAVPNGGIVVAPGPCYWQINYTSTTVTATDVRPPQISLEPSGHSPSIPNQAVTFTANVYPPPPSGTVSFANGGTAISGCTAAPINATTGDATCTTSFSTVGNYAITATYSGSATTAPAGPSTSITQVVVPAPTASINNAATNYEYVTGQQIAGTASDAGGPGVIAVLVYYTNLLTGAPGELLATCASCGVTQTSVTWDIPVTTTGPVPLGIYTFIAQAIDANDNFGPGSSPNSAFVVN